LRSIRWVAVVVGGAVALLTGRLVSFVLASTILDYFVFVGAFSVFLAHFLGGFVAGRMAYSSPGLNGGMTAVLSALGGVVGFLISVLRAFSSSALDSENGGLYLATALGFAFFFFPVSLLAGYLGGKLGGHSRPLLGDRYHRTE
jgi:hypothetical protein